MFNKNIATAMLNISIKAFQKILIKLANQTNDNILSHSIGSLHMNDLYR